jgi:hypothetical protein
MDQNNQQTQTCKSKYHEGDRNISVSLFRVNSPRRCICCTQKAVRKATSVYQGTTHGKQTKRARHLKNPEKNHEYTVNYKTKMIALDCGRTYLYRIAKKRARQANLEFTITPQDVGTPDTCPVLGIPLYFSDVRTDNTPSLDRVDNTKGYTPGNVQVISWLANRLKQDLSIQNIRSLYQYLVRYLPKE